jgi:hypothetical protein
MVAAAPEQAVRASEPWRYAGQRLVAVGRGTVVGCALTGRAYVRVEDRPRDHALICLLYVDLPSL